MSDHKVVRPGDTVLIRLDHHPSPEESEVLIAQLEKAMPGCAVVIMFGVEVLSVYRPDPEETGNGG